MLPARRIPFEVVAMFGNIRDKCGNPVNISSPSFSACFVNSDRFAKFQARNSHIDFNKTKIITMLHTVPVVVGGV